VDGGSGVIGSLPFVTDDAAPPLTVWLITLAILAVVGVGLLIVFLVVPDPFSYLAGAPAPSGASRMAFRA
jgi:hypothetical protein